MARKNREYADDFKNESISLAIRSSSISGTAKELGIPEATLHGWVRNNTIPKKLATQSENVVDLHDELKKLRKENARLKEEREILKKAAAYFAKECK